MKYRILNSSKYAFGNFVYDEIRIDDAEKIRIWRNSQVKILRQNRELTKSDQIEYLNDYVYSELDKIHPNQILFAIKKESNLIGYGGITNIPRDPLRGEISFLGAKNSVNYSAMFLNFLEFIRNIAFEEIGLKKIFTETYSFRISHIQVLEDFGFNLEGVLTSHNIIDGINTDSLIHGLLKVI